ncbi:MAG: carboxypeptidase-like regulatory domain-containing protein [Acidobacteriota bacterium]|nr:carboxypeptidase-like regulatory domain-containing protein [Acidobacteriota bacterium]
MRVRFAVSLAVCFRNCICAAICFPTPLAAQTSTATVVGSLHDVNGAAVADASVNVRNLETNELRTERSNADGGFTIPNLAPGFYDLDIQMEGFKALHQTKLELEIEQTARLDLAAMAE